MKRQDTSEANKHLGDCCNIELGLELSRLPLHGKSKCHGLRPSILAFPNLRPPAPFMRCWCCYTRCTNCRLEHSQSKHCSRLATHEYRTPIHTSTANRAASLARVCPPSTFVTRACSLSLQNRVKKLDLQHAHELGRHERLKCRANIKASALKCMSNLRRRSCKERSAPEKLQTTKPQPQPPVGDDTMMSSFRSSESSTVLAMHQCDLQNSWQNETIFMEALRLKSKQGLNFASKPLKL